MNQSLPLDIQSGAAAPVMVYSRHARDALLACVSALGWRTAGARRRAGLEGRVTRAGADVLLVDARSDPAIVKDVADLAPKLGRSGVAIVALYEAGSDDSLALVRAGATHILSSPHCPAELQACLIAAKRAAARSLGGTALRPPETGESLTGLAQAGDLRRWLAQQGRAEAVWLLIVSLSRFDAVNEALGSSAADAVLRAIGNRLEPLLAESGLRSLVARMAGAEFGIALSGDLPAERLLLLANTIVERVGRPVATAGQTVRLGCQVGIAGASAGARDLSSIIRRAAAAVADARREGAGPVRLVTADETAHSGRLAGLQADLRAALGKDEIEILFQPQFSVASGRIEGVEALARWRHPTLGQIGAKTLFAVAEQSDYLVELSAHIQRRALESAAVWPAALSRLRLSLNVTAQDVRHPGFAQRFLTRVESSGFPKQRLTVELTESGLMEDLEVASRVLAKFRLAGCRVAIDDFGTGYSSLAYLKALPADYLKLDHGLSAEITGSERDSVVVRGAIQMAHSLGLAVIAEGVESENQLGMLARAGCSHFQGFLRAGPLDVPALQKLVEAED